MVDSVVNQLSEVELFSALAEDDLEAVARLAREEHYPTGTLVFEQGGAGHAGYVVGAGELRALRVDAEGVQREVRRLTPSHFVGESSLLLGEPHDATVEVVKDATLIIVGKEDFEDLLAQRPWILDSLKMSPEVKHRRRTPRFDWQEPDEVTALVLRKHDLLLVGRLVLPACLLVLILVGFYLWGTTSFIGLLVGGLCVALPLLLALYYVVDHFNDKYILTNRRIVHDEHVFLIRRSRVGARLNNIQSIQKVQDGVWANSFDYGDLLIETAGEPGGLILFRKVPNPATVQRAIFDQMERTQAQSRAEERTAIADALYGRLRDESPREDSPDDEGQDQEQLTAEETLSSWQAPVLALLSLVRYFFPPLREEDGDVITWRKHWVALLAPIARPTLVMVLVTLVVAKLLDSNGDPLSILLGYGIVLLFLVPWWLWEFEDWQNEVYQITPSRIIDIERRPLGLREERREATLGMIQNVSLRVPGLIGRVLGYGSVTIETAGAGAFTFDYVKDPEDVQAEIFRYVEAFEEHEREKRAQNRREELLDWFTIYDQMRRPEDPPRDNSLGRPSSDRMNPSDPSPG